MAVNRPGTPVNVSLRRRTAADIANDVLAFIAKVAAAAFCGALLYLAYTVFSGALRVYPIDYLPAQSNQLTHNVYIAGLVLEISAGVGSVALIALLWGWDAAGLLFAIAGGILYGALPYFGVPFLSDPSRSLLRANHPGADLLTAWRYSGMMLLAAGGLLFIGWAWDRLQITLSAPRRIGGGVKLPFYSACWQTHFCRDEISRLCSPGRQGYHKSCWRHKSGCMCDESIADRVMAEARAKMGKDAEKWLGKVAKAPAPTWADHFRSTYHPAPHQKIACAKCQIYNLHEVQKHRLLAPFVVAAIPALMLFKADSLHSYYGGFIAAVDRFTLHLGYDPARTTAVQSQLRGALDVPSMEWLVYGMAALALITLGARLLEFWCFTAKL